LEILEIGAIIKDIEAEETPERVLPVMKLPPLGQMNPAPR
jgi:hypothetical protein